MYVCPLKTLFVIFLLKIFGRCLIEFNVPEMFVFTCRKKGSA